MTCKSATTTMLCASISNCVTVFLHWLCYFGVWLGWVQTSDVRWVTWLVRHWSFGVGCKTIHTQNKSLYFNSDEPFVLKAFTYYFMFNNVKARKTKEYLRWGKIRCFKMYISFYLFFIQTENCVWSYIYLYIVKMIANFVGTNEM